MGNRASSTRFAPPGRPSRTAAAAVLLVLAVGAPPAAAQSPGFAIDPPAAWTAAAEPGANRATLARDSADLTADLPTGPRIRISSSAATLPTPEPEIDRVVEDPGETTLGGRPAVSIGLETKAPTGPIRRRVIVSSAHGGSWRVDLEAPGAGWDAAIGEMESALAGIRVGAPGPIAIGPTPGAPSAGGPAPVATPGPAIAGAAPVARGGGGATRRRGLDGSVIAIGALAFLALGLLGALLVARRGGFAGRGATVVELEILDPGGGGRRARVHSLPAVIGRDPESDVVLADPEVSRRHARLAMGPDGLVVEDLDSAAGTIVDGRAVRRAVVGPGSELALGRTRIVIR